MRCTVAICTWNRADMLRGALASLASVQAPEGGRWDLLVVDNGSTDHTAEVVEAFSARLPLRYVIEPRPGLSHARNRAVSELRSDYVLWIDDDAEVDPGWLAAYVGAFRRHPEAVVFGGPIHPRLEGDPPSWIRATMDRVGHAYARLDLGPRPIGLGPSMGRLPYGTNYAIRTREQRRYAYPADLGRRRGELRPGGEEIAVMLAILEAGGEGRWVPEASVTHRIDPARQTTAYLRRYATADALHEELAGGAAPRRGVSKSLPYLLLRALALELRYRARRVLSPPEVWVGDLLGAADAWGRVEARRHPRRTGP